MVGAGRGVVGTGEGIVVVASEGVDVDGAEVPARVGFFLEELGVLEGVGARFGVEGSAHGAQGVAGAG